MPIFDYQCDKCGLVEEKFIIGHAKFSPRELVCMKCDTVMRRLIGAPRALLGTDMPGEKLKLERHKQKLKGK